MSEFVMQTFEAPLGSIGATAVRKEMYEKFIKYSIFDMGFKVGYLDKKEESPVFHFKVPFGDNYKYKKKGYFDVVIECIPPKSTMESQLRFAMYNALLPKEEKITVYRPDTLDGYSFRIFSNSQRFVFAYTFVYKYKNLLIPWIPNIKYSHLALTKPPLKTNPAMVVYYERSIWHAYFYMKRMKLFDKNILSKYIDNKITKQTIINSISSQDDKMVEYNILKKHHQFEESKIDMNKKILEKNVFKFKQLEKRGELHISDTPVDGIVPSFSGYFIKER